MEQIWSEKLAADKTSVWTAIGHCEKRANNAAYAT